VHELEARDALVAVAIGHTRAGEAGTIAIRG
jgi:hypothetical protein